MTEALERVLLKVSGLSVDFVQPAGRWKALENINLSIRKGEVLGLVGESGAGKSLTGAAIIRLLPPRAQLVAGDIEVDRIKVQDLSPSQLNRLRGQRIGSVFQDPLTSLDPLFTVGDQLVETIRSHLPIDRSEAKQRAIKLLDEVGIPAASRRFSQYPNEFSGGMRQRVVIALALCADPTLLIADEPTTALDVSIQAQVLSLLRRLCEERDMGMLLITHDLGVIAETADRVAVLYAGRVVEEGAVGDVLVRPMHPYSGGLMNAIPRIGRDLDRLPQIAGSMPRRSHHVQGCAFGPRCAVRQTKCSEAQPELTRLGMRHVACFNPQGGSA